MSTLIIIIDILGALEKVLPAAGLEAEGEGVGNRYLDPDTIHDARYQTDGSKKNTN